MKPSGGREEHYISNFFHCDATMLSIEISSRSNVHQQVVNLKIRCVIKIIALW